ncbi:heparinase II/III family protein, partial [Acinetobacter baumannii]
LKMMLALFDEHGAHIRRNLEFSYLATSNHYHADLVGLLWLGLLLPELSAARDWRDLALRELRAELDKQILDDGADDESSTGYHR